ncbi:MAG: ATP-binding protein, partial [Chloroflexota bacterium]
HNLHIADINLTRLLQKSVDLLKQKIDSKELVCKLDLPDEMLMVRGDQFILGEVIYQLLHNAIIFNKPGGKIFIRAYTRVPDEVSEITNGAITFIEIEDTGIGVPSTDLEKIFDKFYQVEEHLTRGVGGLGLGLTIARRGVEQHGGELSVTSQLGHGSTFKVKLPPLAELRDVSIDNRLDVAHQQMLTYAKDMAQAVASQRRISKKLEQVQTLSTTLTEKLKQLCTDGPQQQILPDTLRQAQDIVQKLVELSQSQA